MSTLADLIINGNNKSNGGQYHKVEINGNGKIFGDTTCEKFVCNGKGTVNGNLSADNMAIHGYGNIFGEVIAKKISSDGHSHLGGDVVTKKLEVNGHSSIAGSLKAENAEINGWVSAKGFANIAQLSVDGKCKMQAGLRSEDIHVNGTLTVQGDCECDQFTGHGKFDISGLLSAEHIDINLFWHSKAKEIGGHSVSIRRQEDLLVKLLNTFKSVKLDVETIEADMIEISHTKAKVVRGKDVVIGENCEIELVEHTGTIQIHPSAQVQEVKQYF